MKKYITLALAVIMLALTLAACGGDTTPTPGDNNGPAPTDNIIDPPSGNGADETLNGNDTDTNGENNLTEPNDDGLPTPTPDTNSTDPSPNIQSPSPPPSPSPSPTPVTPALSTAQILEKIESREVIDEARLPSMDTDLIAMLKTYNEQTRTLYDHFLFVATEVFKTFTEETQQPWHGDAEPHYPISQEMADDMSLRVANNSLYRDHTQRFLDDPLLFPIIDKEGGGSGGMWPYTWHTFLLDHYPEIKTMLAEYFELVENLEEQLKA